MKYKNPHSPNIKKIKSWLLYHTCHVCGVSFKNTLMWKYTYCADEYGSGTRYVCEFCVDARPNTGIAELLMDHDDYKKYTKINIQISRLQRLE